ncbi:hypothetical protein CAPTEDRAFT_202372, partial [Capitella teleta]
MDSEFIEDLQSESAFLSQDIKELGNKTILDFLSAPVQNGTAEYNQSVYDMVSNSSHEHLSVRIIYYLDLYFVPIMVVVGLLGNLISFLVFVATYMRRLSSSVYLAALSMVDMVFL